MASTRIHVRFLASASNAGGVFKKGRIYLLKREDAQPLIDGGVAEKVTAEDAAAEGAS